MFNKDLLEIACIITEGSRYATELCASLFVTEMLWPSSPKFCFNFGGGCGLKQVDGNRFDGR